MPADLSPIDKAKYAAARRASDLVEDGMKVGLGTGSTAAWMATPPRSWHRRSPTSRARCGSRVGSSAGIGTGIPCVMGGDGILWGASATLASGP